MDDKTVLRLAHQAGIPATEGFDAAAIRFAKLLIKESPVAGGDAVSAAEDSQSAAGGSPAFKKWADETFGDVRPQDMGRLMVAFEAGRYSRSKRASFDSLFDASDPHLLEENHAK